MPETPKKCRADLYGEDTRVLPMCQCGWEGEWVPTYDEAADAYAAHRLGAFIAYDVGYNAPPEAADA